MVKLVLVVVNLLHHVSKLGFKLNRLVIAFSFLEKVVVLDFLYCQAILGVFIECYTQNFT